MIYEFGDFELDTRRCELRRAGLPQHLEPQVYAVLCHLIENGDRLVTSKELMERVWGSRFVTPGTLNSRIKALRQALDDDGTEQRVIETVRGSGFRVGLPVTARNDGPRTATLNGSSQTIKFCRAADGVRIAYATSGNPDGPPLVKPANWLTHLDLDVNSPVWRHWVAELGRTYRLIRYDERGSGLSDHTVPDGSFESWVNDLAAVVDAEQLDRFSLLGISQGCAVGVSYAARNPERVDKLVLYGGYACGRGKRNPTPQQELEMTLLRSLMRVGWGKENPAFRQVFGMLFVPEGTREQHQWFADLAHTMPVENALAVMDMTYAIDVRELCASVRAPTLVLHSRGDAMIPFEQGRMLASLIPGATFLPLDSRNHVLLESEPAWTRFLHEVRSFLH